MSESTLWVQGECGHGERNHCSWGGGGFRPPYAAELIAEIRSRVESGTIKGEVVRIAQNAVGQDITVPPLANFKHGDYLLIGPVSDGGSET